MKKPLKNTDTAGSARIRPLGKELYELTKKKAYEVYCNRVRSNKPGDAAGDWLYAERLIKKELNPI